MSSLQGEMCKADDSKSDGLDLKDVAIEMNSPPTAMSSNDTGLEENNQRLFFTRRDPRRVRLLKLLHLIPRTPSSITYAQLGVQADLPSPSAKKIESLRAELGEALQKSREHFKNFSDTQSVISDLECDIQSLRNQIGEIQTTLAEKERVTLDLREQLNRSELKVEKLRQDHRAASLELTENKIQLTKSEIQLHHMAQENMALRSKLEELNLDVERLELDVAFLIEEKGDLETSLNEHKSFLDIVTKEKDESFSKEEELKNTLLQARIDSAEQIGKYIDELNEAHEEKRKILNKNLSGSPKNLRRALTTTDSYLLLKEEKNRLVDQVELMSTQAVFQDLLIEKYHGQLFRLAKLLEDDQKHNGRERSLLKDELSQALELVSKKPTKTANFSLQESPKKNKYALEPRNCSSLPGSPLRPSKHLHSSLERQRRTSSNELRDKSSGSAERKKKSDVKPRVKQQPGNKSSGEEQFYSPTESPQDEDEQPRKSNSKRVSRPWSTDAWKKTVPGKPSKSRKPLLQ